MVLTGAAPGIRRPAARRVPAAAPARVAALLGGARRTARVVHAGADAAYLRVDDPVDGVAERCLAVLAHGAYAVPCGLRTTEPTVALAHGEVGTVGEGALLVGEYDVRVGRVVDAATPRIGAGAAPPVGGVDVLLAHPAVAAVRSELPPAALTALVAGDPGAVVALLGRGSGLTPVGDDVLCGYLAGCRAAGRTDRAVAVVGAVEEHAPRRTTALSAELLRSAVAGDVLPEFADLVRAISQHGDTGPAAALARLVAVGHTSGAGLALGLALALPTTEPTTQPTTQPSTQPTTQPGRTQP